MIKPPRNKYNFLFLQQPNPHFTQQENMAQKKVISNLK